MKRILLSLLLPAVLLAPAACGKVEGSAGRIVPVDGDGVHQGGSGGGGTLEGEPASLQGSAYIPFILDSETAQKLDDRIVADLRPDDEAGNYLYIWEDTYTDGPGIGLNFYGNTAGYLDFLVGAKNWSGAGFFVTSSPVSLAPILTDNYYFHFAYKGKENVAHLLYLSYGDGVEYKFAIGQGSYTDNGVAYEAISPLSGSFEPGVWNEYEFPAAETGIDYSAAFPAAGTNMLVCLSGEGQGKELCLDAAFFYKK